MSIPSFLAAKLGISSMHGTRVGAGMIYTNRISFIPLHVKPQARLTTLQHFHYFLEIFIVYSATRNILNPSFSALASPQASFFHDHVQAT